MPVRIRDRLYAYEVNFYELLETAKTFSTCGDKQVAALSCIGDDILSVAWNKPNHKCAHKCDVKNKKCASHAETGLALSPGSTVYVTLFPCVACQMYLFSAGVKEVYVFGSQHKEDCGLLNITCLPDVVGLLTSFNGLQGQFNIVIGEMAELTFELCNSQRKDARESNIAGELIDVELQMHCVRRFLKCSEVQEMKSRKYATLITKFGGKDES